MHVDKSQPLGPRQPGRSDSARPSQRAADPGRSAPLRDVYEGASAATERAGAGPDRVDLSSAGRQLGQDVLPGPQGPETPEDRAARIESLARDLTEGRLFSPERLQRAATRLLGGE